MANRPPTKAMLRVLRQMANGWDLRWEPAPRPCYLEHPSDQTEIVRDGTVAGLDTRSLIIWTRSTAALTAKGRELAGA